MTENYSFPITPPPELVQQWRKSAPVDAAVNNAYERHIATRAAQWGADQELEACCEWLKADPELVDEIRAARRPKPPSLKELALTALTRYTTGETILTNESVDTIRRALEQLDD